PTLFRSVNQRSQLPENCRNRLFATFGLQRPNQCLPVHTFPPTAFNPPERFGECSQNPPSPIYLTGYTAYLAAVGYGCQQVGQCQENDQRSGWRPENGQRNNEHHQPWNNFY